MQNFNLTSSFTNVQLLKVVSLRKQAMQKGEQLWEKSTIGDN